MALTAAEVIRHARDLHGALSEANAPTPLGLREMSRTQRDLVHQASLRVPGLHALILTITLPIDFAAGIDLSALVPGGIDSLLRADFESGIPQTPAVRGRFIPWEQRETNFTLPAYTYRNGVLYLLGLPAAYSTFGSMELQYTPRPADVADVDDTLMLDETAREALAWSVAAFWLLRMVGIPNFNVTADVASAYNQRAVEERMAYLSHVTRLAQVQDYRVRVVF